ncbi:hypothetical protein PVAND_008974 [Polypedilum vanderplanki]|uniref:Uncharacterized protein n=1 Tax=Polypedilum vanderplanki TaxID=319348 RepID=A0A9J6CCP9_POLVA|nr:hypothetical protein PVAND_008974 [Polypedilum vanderplanki]
MTSNQQNTESLESTRKSPSSSKPQKHVTFSDVNLTQEAQQQPGEIIRNFYMMESQEDDQNKPQQIDEQNQQPAKPNFLVGGDHCYDEIEEKDEFPPRREMNGSIPKTFSDATIIDKRRRLR